MLGLLSVGVSSCELCKSHLQDAGDDERLVAQQERDLALDDKQCAGPEGAGKLLLEARVRGGINLVAISELTEAGGHTREAKGELRPGGNAQFATYSFHSTVLCCIVHQGTFQLQQHFGTREYCVQHSNAYRKHVTHNTVQYCAVQYLDQGAFQLQKHF